MAETKVFVFAHQDDEILIAGKIRHEVEAGTRVCLVWCNDGSGGTGLYKSEEEKAKGFGPYLEAGEKVERVGKEREREITAAVREKEAREAMGSLGVREERLTFLRHSAEWMKAPENVVELVEELTQCLDALRPSEVYVDAWEGAHFTHDITHFGVARAVRRLAPRPRLYEFPEYPLLESYLRSPLKLLPRGKVTDALVHLLHYGVGRFADPDGTEVLLRLSPGQMELKMGLAKYYPSQGKLTGDFEKIIQARQTIGAMIPELRVEADVEMWRAVRGERDYRVPPAPGHRYSKYNQGVSDEDYIHLFTRAIDLLEKGH